MEKERAIDRLILFAQYAKRELKVVKGRSSFESYCGLSNGYLTTAVASRSKGNIGSDIIARIMEAFPMLNIEWLCSGRGRMIKDEVLAREEMRKEVEREIKAMIWDKVKDIVGSDEKNDTQKIP